MSELDRARALHLGRKTIANQVLALQALSEALDEAFWACARLLC